LLLLVFVSSIHAFPNTTGNQVLFAPFTLEPTSIVPPTYLSFNFDWNLNVTQDDAWTNASIGWSLDLQNPALIKLATALAPANLRIGGSPEDTAEYTGFPGTGSCSDTAKEKHTCLTPARWEEIIEFASKCGLRILFGLNLMYGRENNGDWDPSNMEALVKYTASKYPTFKHGFGLGNEKEFLVSPQDTASCYNILRTTVNQAWPDADKRPIIVGPDLNTRPDWLSQFIAALDSPTTVDGVSYHMYVGYGRSLDLPKKMLKPGWLDFSHYYISAHHRSLTRSKAAPSTEIWITETAAAWASGTAGVCDGFVSGFWYMDQLGMAATDGHSAMCRQCLVGGNYSLIDQVNGFKPNPDYWTAWLYKHLMGTVMLAIDQVMPEMGDYDPTVRAYLSCTPPTAPGYKDGAVTMSFINQDSSNKSIELYQGARLNEFDGRKSWPPTPPDFEQLPRIEFVLTSATGNVLARDVKLNGATLALNANGDVPKMVGKNGTALQFVVPPQSYGFAVYPDAAAPACSMHHTQI